MKRVGKIWGETSELFFGNNVEVHYITITEGGFCSKHKHKSKFNRFVVLRGILKVTIYNEHFQDETMLYEGDEFTVQTDEYHRFEAIQPVEALEIYWVELSRDDIQRQDSGGIFGSIK